MSNPRKLTIKFSVGGEEYPTAYEIGAEAEAFTAMLKLFKDYKAVSVRHKPVMVPHKNDFRRIRVEDILYLEAEGNYCTIHFRSGKDLSVAVALGTLADDFCEQGIVRCHKCYAVNIPAVDCIGANYLVLQGGKRLEIGNTFKKNIVSCFNYRGTKSRKHRVNEL